jgi:protein-disulfide isomerase
LVKLERKALDFSGGLGEDGVYSAKILVGYIMMAKKGKRMGFKDSCASKTMPIVVLTGLCSVLLLTTNVVRAADSQPAFKINGKVTTVAEVAKADQSSFFEIEKRRFDLIESTARDQYMEAFWQQKAKESGKSSEEAKRTYFEKNLKLADSEIKDTLAKFKDHPQLKKLGKDEQEKQVRDYLSEKNKREVIDGIVNQAIKKGDLVVMYPRPSEPVFQIAINSTDPVRYGPNPEDIKPMGCEGDACPITIVEYSEYQCPFCKRVIPTTKQVLTDYKGKARWITRDFPLSFHDRAKPASVAARCAGEQGKFWNMYLTLFDNQGALGDADFEKYAGSINGLDVKKWQACVKNPAQAMAIIESNIESGVKLGVSGTPAYFINGRRLSGALPFEEFKRVIDDELARGKKS